MGLIHKQFRGQAGFTLVEVVIVITLLAILAAIALPRLAGFSEVAKLRADQATVRTLNNVTPLYRSLDSETDPFADGTNSSSDLLQALVNADYLAEMVEAQTEGAAFAWLLTEEKWYLLLQDSFYVISLDDGFYLREERPGQLLGEYSGDAKDIVIPAFLQGQLLTLIGQDTFNNNNLVAVAFSADSQVREIFRRAFANNNLTEIAFPDSLEIIGQYAFRNNNDLTRISIGSNVTIEDQAFHRDNKFRDAYQENGAGTYLFVDGEWLKQ